MHSSAPKYLVQVVGLLVGLIVIVSWMGYRLGSKPVVLEQPATERLPDSESAVAENEHGRHIGHLTSVESPASRDRRPDPLTPARSATPPVMTANAASGAGDKTQEDQAPEPARRMVDEPVFRVPLAFAMGKPSPVPVTMSRARELVPGAFSQTGRGPSTGPVSNITTAPQIAPTSPEEEQALAKLQNTFVETMKNSGLQPNSAEYLELWNATQAVSDQQYAIWFGWDRAAARQAAAYKLASEHAHALSTPVR